MGSVLEDTIDDLEDYEQKFDELFLKIKEKIYKELNQTNKEFRNRQ